MIININGVEWRECDRCGLWINKTFCDCLSKKMDKELERLMSSMRKQNNHLIMISQYGKEQRGMSCMNINISKFRTNYSEAKK